MAGTDHAKPLLLTVNCGSSSLKLALFSAHGATLSRELTARAERIGAPESRIEVTGDDGRVLLDDRTPNLTHALAMHAAMRAVERLHPGRPIGAVGHRVVHGGSRLVAPVLISLAALAEMRAIAPMAPEHLPQAINAIELLMAGLPGLAAGLPQVACFDTAFHASMPDVHRRLAIPQSLHDAGVHRYGFHGLSYEFVVRRLAQIRDTPAHVGRAVIAHLGNGCSMAAVNNGVGVDTTMGFSPCGGLVMGTRCGDLDPGVLMYAMANLGIRPDKLARMLLKESGMLGISGKSGDVRDLLAIREHDERAALALEVFCTQARKYVAGLASALDGIDTLVFTGGIGENAAWVRARICDGLGFMGVLIDPARNAPADAPARAERVISPDGAAVQVRVIATDEEAMIAAHTRALVPDAFA